MKLLKSILFKLVVIIMVCIVSFNLYNFICLNVLKEDLATVNGYAVLEVVSGSMEPTIHVGDMIVIDTKVESYEKDDIITFYDVNGSFVTHRILNINGNKMITKGDNNDSPDEEMNTDSIVGKVVKTIPSAGKILASLKSPLVMILILVIGVLVCFLTSTDDNLVPIDLTEEEKEFLEYKKNKVLQAKANNVNFVDYSEDNKKKAPKKSTKKKKAASDKETDTSTKTVKKTSKVEGTKKNTSTKKSGATTVKKATTKTTSKDKVNATKPTVKKTTTKKTTAKKAASSNTKKAEATTKTVKASSKVAKGTVKKVEKSSSKSRAAKSTKNSSTKKLDTTKKNEKKAVKSTSNTSKKTVKPSIKVEKKPVKKTGTKKDDEKTIKKSTKKVTGTKKTVKK